MHNHAIVDPAFHETNRHPITPAPPVGIWVANHFSASYGYHVRRPAGTRDWLLTFTLDGVGCYRLGDQPYLCRAGDVMLLEPGAMHDYATLDQSQPWNFYWVHFLPRPHWVEWLQLPLRTAGLRGVTIDDGAMKERIEQAFVRLLHDLHSSTRFQLDLAATALEEILICIAQHREHTNPQALDPRIAAVLQRLNANYREPVTIGALAQQVSLSPSRLSHLFKAQVGQSIRQWWRSGCTKPNACSNTRLCISGRLPMRWAFSRLRTFPGNSKHIMVLAQKCIGNSSNRCYRERISVQALFYHENSD